MFTYNFDDLALVGMVADEDGVYPIEKTLTTEDKKTFLEAMSGNAKAEDLVAEFEALKVALKDGTIKHNKWSINASSYKAYIKKTEHLHYGRISSRRWGADDDYYYNLDGVQYTFRDWVSDIDSQIKRIHNYDSRFRCFIRERIEVENKKAEELKKANYKTDNADRIRIGRKVEKLMNSFGVTVPYAVSEDASYHFNNDTHYEVQTSSNCHFRGWSSDSTTVSLNTNKYGELTNNGEVVDQGKAEEIAKLILKYGKKISVLLDDLNDDIREMLGE